MDLSLGNSFPAQRVSGELIPQRFGLYLRPLERIAQGLSRKAVVWLANRRVWARRVPMTPGSFEARLTAELDALRGEMLARTGVKIAVGAGSSCVVARTASRLAGAGGSRVADNAAGALDAGAMVVPRGREREFLAPLPLRLLHGVCPATFRAFTASGLVTIGELQRVPKAALLAQFGPQEGLRLWRAARGLDPAGQSQQRAQ
jgi:nucleotidyltransferase/DNA polymerase involved in DNA repair